MAGSHGDDFNRLYERLVVQRTSSKKRIERVPLEVSEATNVVAETLHRPSIVAHENMNIRRHEQQEHDAHVTSTAKRLRLTRNLRGLAQRMNCSSNRLACCLIDASVQDARRFLKKYHKAKTRRIGRHKECYLEDQRLRLEKIAARCNVLQSCICNPA